LNRPYYKQITGLRAVAVLAVLSSHWIFNVRENGLRKYFLFRFFQDLDLGFLGVNLFFVLSGFLITEILIKRQNSNNLKVVLREFYINRILRIFPIYYGVVIVAFIANLDNGRHLFLFNLTYTLNFYNSFTGDIGHGLSHLWSLCVEEQFYLVWPLLVLVTSPKFHLRLFITIIVLSVLFKITLVVTNAPNYSTCNYRLTPSCMDALGIGALLAYLKIHKPLYLGKLLKSTIVPAILLAVYLLIVLSGSISPSFVILKGIVLSSFCFYIIGRAAHNHNNKLGRVLNNKFVQFLGKISYGVYLYHLIISTLLQETFKHLFQALLQSQEPSFFYYNQYLLSAPLYFLITIIIASISFQIVEKPLLGLKDKSKKSVAKVNNRNYSIRESVLNSQVNNSFGDIGYIATEGITGKQPKITGNNEF
jgi:peptidoglycan/LPS O-acetylase OafA/YrhL